MSSFTDPLDATTTFQYNADGRLVREDLPDGPFKTLERTETPVSVSVKVTTAMGRSTIYSVESLSDGRRSRTVQEPDGATTIIITSGATETLARPDGTTTTITTTGDPRWGMRVPYAASTVIKTPAGLTKTINVQRRAQLNDPADPMSVKNLTTDVNLVHEDGYGDTTSVTYEAVNHTLKQSWDQGGSATMQLDGRGRVTLVQLGTSTHDVDPVELAYDARGRLVSRTQGSESQTYIYDSANRLTAQRNAAGEEVHYAYDADDRVTSITLPGGQVYHFTYDLAGRRLTQQMPNGAVYSSSSTVAGSQSEWLPPGTSPGAGYLRGFNLDGVVTSETLPSGTTRVYNYDAMGRFTSGSTPDAVSSLAYDVTTARIANLTRTPAAGTAAAIDNIFDGRLYTKRTYSGPASAVIDYSYDDTLRVSQVKLTSDADVVTTDITYAPDGRPATYGPFEFSYWGPVSTVSNVGDGTFDSERDYDKALRANKRSDSVNGTPVYGYNLPYDATGRLAARTETTGGTQTAFAYTYDANGQLLQVQRGGVTVETYTYDANGNRTSRKGAAGPVEAASFDNLDRLISRGTTDYSYDANGALSGRSGAAFHYGPRGELQEATVGGTTITYAHDAYNRLIARTGPAGTRRYYYADPSNYLRVTAVRDEAGLLTSLYYDHLGHLLAFERGGARFYVSCDQVGTPRVVVNSAG